jgi:hypothetical protein
VLWAIDLLLWVALMGLILNDVTHEPTSAEDATKEKQKRAESRDREGAVQPVLPYWSAEEKAHRADEGRYWRHHMLYRHAVEQSNRFLIGECG